MEIDSEVIKMKMEIFKVGLSTGSLKVKNMKENSKMDSIMELGAYYFKFSFFLAYWCETLWRV